MSETPIIEVRDVWMQFGGFNALSNVSLALKKGELTSIIGPNGAGKSTLFNVLSGSLKPTAGTVFALGRDVTRLPQHRITRLGVAKSFQITSVFPQLTVEDNVRIALQGMGSRFDFWTKRAGMRAQIEQAREILHLVGLGDRFDRNAGTLAHGEQRSLEIAMALASNPRALLLDEPTAGMSPEETRGMMDLILRLAQAQTVVLVEHKMKLIMGVSDRIVVLHHGEVIADGAPAEIRANAEVRRVYLGEEA
ncbi:MAG: ABC transporter ATP-binding protein [Beijerinckiaceae bacterium]